MQRWRQRDPIHLHHRRLLAAGLAEETELREIEAAAGAVIDDAVSFAMASPVPDLSALFEDMYANPFPISGS